MFMLNLSPFSICVPASSVSVDKTWTDYLLQTPGRAYMETVLQLLESGSCSGVEIFLKQQDTDDSVN